MTQNDVVARVAPLALVIGGLSMAAIFVPFTLAHGPTSYNEEHIILGWDMHGWGLLLGVVPNVLIAGGLWTLRQRIALGRRAAMVTIAVICVALVLDALVNVAFRALGAPFVLILLAPATIALAALIPAGTRARVVVAALGVTLATGTVLALIPLETSDSFGGYRIYGTLVYGIGGLLWALLGLALRRPREG